MLSRLCVQSAAPPDLKHLPTRLRWLVRTLRVTSRTRRPCFCTVCGGVIMSVAQAVEWVSDSRCPPLPRATSRTTYAFTQMSRGSIELFIASTHDLYIVFSLHWKHRVTRTRVKPSVLKVKCNDLLSLSEELILCVPPLTASSHPVCSLLLSAVGMAASHRSPAESPQSGPLMWLRCITASRCLMPPRSRVQC